MLVAVTAEVAVDSAVANDVRSAKAEVSATDRVAKTPALAAELRAKIEAFVDAVVDAPAAVVLCPARVVDTLEATYSESAAGTTCA